MQVTPARSGGAAAARRRGHVTFRPPGLSIVAELECDGAARKVQLSIAFHLRSPSGDWSGRRAPSRPWERSGRLVLLLPSNSSNKLLHMEFWIKIHS